MRVMTKPIVAIDVDSVLFPINEEILIPEWARHGLEVELEDITDFDYLKCLTKEHKRIAFAQFRRRYLYDGYNITEEIEESLSRMRGLYRVIVVSSPFAQHAESKWKFCQRAGFDHTDIVLVGDKTLVDCDVLLDDRPSTLAEIGLLQGLVFDRPWNQQNYLRHHLRATSWASVPRMVDKLTEGL